MPNKNIRYKCFHNRARPRELELVDGGVFDGAEDLLLLSGYKVLELPDEVLAKIATCLGFIPNRAFTYYLPQFIDFAEAHPDTDFAWNLSQELAIEERLEFLKTLEREEVEKHKQTQKAAGYDDSPQEDGG